MSLEEDAYLELMSYTLTRGDAAFIHQHVVDAYAAQNANAKTKPISVAFALVGLYLHLEKQFTGREVQRAHMKLAKHRRQWPEFTLPMDRGEITSIDVMAAAEGAARDEAIHAWCESVWRAFGQTRQPVIRLLREYGIVRAGIEVSE